MITIGEFIESALVCGAFVMCIFVILMFIIEAIADIRENMKE